MKKVLTVLCISLAFLGACTRRDEYKEVEVIGISGTLPMILNSTGALFGNDSIKIGDPSLVLTIKQWDGHIRTLEVIEGQSISKVAIASRICIGGKISMPFLSSGKSSTELERMPSYHVGKISADSILVSESCKK